MLELNRSGRVARLVTLLILAAGLGIAVLWEGTAEKGLESLGWHLTKLALVALGLLVCLNTGGMDLSVGATYLLAIGLGLTVNSPFRIGPLLVILAIGISVGFLNGVLVAWSRRSSLLVTLATFIVVRTCASVVLNRLGADAGARARDSGTLLWVIGGLTIAAYLLVWLLLNRSVWGRGMRATGSDPKAAYIAGVSVRASRICGFVLAGLPAALAGYLASLAPQHFLIPVHNAGAMTSAETMTLSALAAVMLAGAPFDPGRGHLLPTFLSALVVTLGLTRLRSYGGSPWMQQTVLALIILISIAVYDRAPRLWED